MTGVAVGATIGAIGSAVYTLPPGCVVVDYGGIAYRHCDEYWLQPRYQGSRVIYVRVSPPF
ncbi:MAG: hypothetical protein AAF362_08425 [Pseudomonadota bacterium]